MRLYAPPTFLFSEQCVDIIMGTINSLEEGDLGYFPSMNWHRNSSRVCSGGCHPDSERTIPGKSLTGVTPADRAGSMNHAVVALVAARSARTKRQAAGGGGESVEAIGRRSQACRNVVKRGARIDSQPRADW